MSGDLQEIADLFFCLMRDLHRVRGEETAVTMSQLRGLAVLSHGGECSLSELARRLDISTPAATGLADRLEAQRLIRRLRDPADRRRTCLSVTEEGRKRLYDLIQCRQEQLREACAALPPEDREALKRGLAALHRAVAATGCRARPGELPERNGDR